MADAWSNYGPPTLGSYYTLPGGGVPQQNGGGVLSTINGVINLVNTGWNTYQNIRGSDGVTSQQCPGQWATDQVAYALSNASAAEVASLQKAYAAANPTVPWRNDPQYLAWTAAGGSDCSVGSESGRVWKGSFDLFMDATLKRLGATPYAPGTTPPPDTIPDNLGATASAGDEFAKIWDAIKKTGENIFRSTVSGAAAGAQTSAQGAAAGSAFGSVTTWVPLLLLGVVAFALVRRR